MIPIKTKHMRLMLTLFSCFISLSIFAQTNPYQADLAQLRAVLQKTPSYKDQITGDKLVSYNELYARLVADTVSNPGDFKYFYNLTQLLFPIRDNHIGFYQLALKKFKTEEEVRHFIENIIEKKIKSPIIGNFA